MELVLAGESRPDTTDLGRKTKQSQGGQQGSLRHGGRDGGLSSVLGPPAKLTQVASHDIRAMRQK